MDRLTEYVHPEGCEDCIPDEGPLTAVLKQLRRQLQLRCRS